MVKNGNLFSEQIKDYVKRNAHFKVVSKDGEEYLKGILSVPNDEGEVIGNFLIEIRNHEKFPFAFPYLFEIGGQIPNEADWHKYSNQSCCLTVPAEEILLCKNGITIKNFIETQAIPFLANYIHRKATGYYKNGDYAHGSKGNYQFYEKLFKTDDQKQWIEYFKIAFGLKKHNVGRNEKCICGADIKYKKCHELVFHKLKLIGKENVLKHLTQ
jgi:hypothetical protein